MATNFQRRQTNKLVLYSLLLLMLVIGIIGPMLQTQDDDENLGMTFLLARVARHHELGRVFHFTPDAPSMVVPSFLLVSPNEYIFGTLKSRLSARFAPAVPAIPLRI
jgi:hypothetical protein